MTQENYSIKDACLALDIPRSSYYSSKKQRIKELSQKNDEEIICKIKEIKTSHPFWGYRRVCAWLKKRESMFISEIKVRKLMKENDLLVEKKCYKARRANETSKPRATKPKEFWGIDMTKFMVTSIGFVYLVIVLDWYTKKIVGFDISLSSKTNDWKKALDMALIREYPNGVRGFDLKLISDNGSQPTSNGFMKDMKNLEIIQIFTSYNNPKGNAETERMIRTIKEEIIWINEFSSFKEAKDVVSNWIEKDYNKNYVHSKLGYLSPVEFENLYNKNMVA